MILLVIDAQKAIMNEKLFACNRFVYNIKQLLETARINPYEVIFVWKCRYAKKISMSEAFALLKNDKF